MASIWVAESVASRGMGGKLRYLLAAGFVALFLGITANEPDHDYLTFLETRSWLLAMPDDEESPLSALVAQRGGAPAIEVRVVPPDSSAAWRKDYLRTARELRRAYGAEASGAPPLLLEVRIGDTGFRSTLAAGPRELDHLEIVRDGSSERYYPDRWSLVPAFLAIILAILTGRVIPSLLLGCLSGAWITNPSVTDAAVHFATDTLWQKTFLDSFHFRIMLFVVFLFMAVGVMARSGGIQGMVEWVRKFARGPVSSQICSFIIGLLVFFDDYTNCIITGSTMRPLTDRNRVSREKLAYIVDSTAAPIAGISLVSTWVAYEISMFATQLTEVSKPDGTLYQKSEGFTVFLQTLPYRFYCIFALMMVLFTIILRREFGPMLGAERRAIHEGKPVADDAQPMLKQGFAELEAPEGAPIRGRNAFAPVLVLVGTAITLMIVFGVQNADVLEGSFGAQLRQVLKNAESEFALMWASLAALVVAIVMATSQRILSPAEALGSALRSATSLVFAVVILILAWCIGHVCRDLGTAALLTATVGQELDAWMLPAVMFLLASLVAFSTGTSYGTMAILLPNIVVLSYTMGEADAAIGGTALMILTIGAVLEGSIFGDHCSPISDTTVLSSVATASDHLHHVRTQAPYAVFVMILAMVCGYLPMTLLSRDWWPLSWTAAALAMVGWLFFVGRNPARATS